MNSSSWNNDRENKMSHENLKKLWKELNPVALLNQKMFDL